MLFQQKSTYFFRPGQVWVREGHTSWVVGEEGGGGAPLLCSNYFTYVQNYVLNIYAVSLFIKLGIRIEEHKSSSKRCPLEYKIGSLYTGRPRPGSTAENPTNFDDFSREVYYLDSSLSVIDQMQRFRK